MQLPFLKDFTVMFLSSIIKLDNVIIGDFNIHVDNTTSYEALEFLTLADTLDFEQHVSGPTHQKGHTLDLFFFPWLKHCQSLWKMFS